MSASRRIRVCMGAAAATLLMASGVLSSHPLVAARAAGIDPTIGAAGDIACDPASPKFNGGNGTSSSCRMKYVAKLLDTSGLSDVLAVGDTQYNDGAFDKYGLSYDPSWGRVKDITHPTPGDHEYKTAGAAGYFQYFGVAAVDPPSGKSYYSFDIPTSDAAKPWHVISLNSNCPKIGGCGPNSNEYKWLVADLAAHPATCTLAFSYKGRFSSGMHGSYTTYKPFWEALFAAHSDIVIDGHDHDYERFAPQDPSGVANAHGVREFIVGTGGVSTQQFGVPGGIANSEYRQQPGRFGALLLTLHPSSYDWAFTAPGGKVLDSGTWDCVS
jgi:hypothetical protein